jgi:hypothetical protein
VLENLVPLREEELEGAHGIWRDLGFGFDLVQNLLLRPEKDGVNLALLGL